MNLRSQRGVAILMAIACALAVTLTAIAVMNLTSRRFFLSAMRSDRELAFYAAEAGVKYAFSRLTTDAAFRDRVAAELNRRYIVSPTAASAEDSEPDVRLRFGKLGQTPKDVEIRIWFRGAGRFEVRGRATYAQ